jgi:competence protein ComEA
VNVNTATEADLERLPGIGPVLARRIVQHRESRGLFRRLDDLLEVEGIGPKLFRRLQPLLRLD